MCARLRSILEETLLDVMFDLPEAASGTRYRVTRGAVDGTEPVKKTTRRRKTGS